MAATEGGFAVSGDGRALLGRIADNLERSRHEPVHAAAAVEAPAPLAAELHDGAALLARFSAEWQALAGQVHEARTANEAAAIVAEICRVHEARTILAWSEAAIGVDGLAEALGRCGLDVDGGVLPADRDSRMVRLQALAEVRVGVTGADALLAESGSVVLASGPGRPRLASLLPPVHVTIARTDRIFQSLEHLLAADPSLGVAGSNLVAISGPSRTADIEMTLTRGVHGPGEVHVILMK